MMSMFNRQGSMWQARERLFSRWKERFFTLTRLKIFQNDRVELFEGHFDQVKSNSVGKIIFLCFQTVMFCE